MSVDTVNYALTTVTRRYKNNPNNFSEQGQRKLIAICECMRDYLMKEDVAGFNNYVDAVLAREPDAADFILEDLFAELGIEIREELTAKLEEE
jgi:hypothetical protein